MNSNGHGIEFQVARVSEDIPGLLEKNVLKVLLYFDVFRYPLTISEIFRFLPSNSVTLEDVAGALRSPFLRERVGRQSDYFFLATSRSSFEGDRREKERRAARMMMIARIMAKIICLFPYVRGVFLSGELSKGVASRKSDIDFVVVTCEHRLWIARTLLILFKKTFLFNRKRFFCLNHLVTEDHLRVETRNLYSATEVATVRSLENDAMFSRFMLANLWIVQYFPNWKLDEHTLRSSRRGTSIVRTCLEALIPDQVASRIDRWLMKRWQQIWGTRYAHLSESERCRNFHCSQYMSTAYGEDYQEVILRSFQDRLQQHELS